VFRLFVAATSACAVVLFGLAEFALAGDAPGPPSRYSLRAADAGFAWGKTLSGGLVVDVREADGRGTRLSWDAGGLAADARTHFIDCLQDLRHRLAYGDASLNGEGSTLGEQELSSVSIQPMLDRFDRCLRDRGYEVVNETIK
jgi:hypothetical protein